MVWIWWYMGAMMNKLRPPVERLKEDVAETYEKSKRVCR